MITGFHLFDGVNHLFVLEGLKSAGIKAIYDEIPRTRNEEGIEVMYNSMMAFSRRLYSKMDLDLMRIKLFEPLDDIVKKPLLYVRDMAPKASFDALVKLYQLLSEHRLRNVVRCDLLPTTDMVASMSREFGIPLTDEEIEQFKKAPSVSDAMEYLHTKDNDVLNEAVSQEEPQHTNRSWIPLDNFNEQYMQQKTESKEVAHKNYMLQNAYKLREQSKHNK